MKVADPRKAVHKQALPPEGGLRQSGDTLDRPLQLNHAELMILGSFFAGVGATLAVELIIFAAIAAVIVIADFAPGK